MANNRDQTISELFSGTLTAGSAVRPPPRQEMCSHTRTAISTLSRGLPQTWQIRRLPRASGGLT